MFFRRFFVQDPPPDYSQVDLENSTPFASTSRPLPDIKSCNFVSLSRQNESVSGSWIIDPSMMVPPALMPPLLSNENEETRKNILLSSHNGSVDAQVYVLASQVEPQRRNRVLIETSSKNGSVSTKVVSQNISINPSHLVLLQFAIVSTQLLRQTRRRFAYLCRSQHPQRTVVSEYTSLALFGVL